MPPSYYRSLSLPILASDPIWLSPRSGFLEHFTGQFTSFSKSERSFGGWWDCQLTLPMRLSQTEDWLIGGLGRHLEVYNPALVKRWAGFVNKITVTAGGDTDSVGPLLDIANRIKAIYTGYDTSVEPPVSGVTQQTGVVNDTNSQALYGIIEKIVNPGESSLTKAQQARDTILTKYRWPETSQNLNLSGSDFPQVQIEALGYFHLLDTYYYTQAGTGDTNLSTKLVAVLAAHPNELFSSDTLDILTNTLQVPVKEDGSNKALSLIRDLIDLGDVNDNPYIFGIYDDRKAVYTSVPTVIEYHRRRSGNKGSVTTPTGRLVYPWDVEAGKWLFREDFLTGQGLTTSLFEDPRAVFVESVTYTAPWDLQINGGRADTITQRLNRLGLGGI